jgi:hypothetical protein
MQFAFDNPVLNHIGYPCLPLSSKLNIGFNKLISPDPAKRLVIQAIKQKKNKYLRMRIDLLVLFS